MSTLPVADIYKMLARELAGFYLLKLRGNAVKALNFQL